MVKKPFDPNAYKKYDQPARKVTKKYFKKFNIDLIDNPNKYCADLIKEGDYYVECEIRNGWKEGKFPWQVVNLPERKEKFLKLDMPIIFFIWNKTLTSAITVKGETVAACGKEIVPNRLVRYGEKFFRIPIDQTKQVYI